MSSKAKNLSKLSAVLAEGGTLTASTTAPTAALGTSTNQLATTAFVGNALNGLINAAPTTLDTLNELAAALGNDSNFATTVTNTLALKAPLASPTFTGTLAVPLLNATGGIKLGDYQNINATTNSTGISLSGGSASNSGGQINLRGAGFTSNPGGIEFVSNGTPVAKIDSAGRVTMPYQPAFVACLNGMNQVVNAEANFACSNVLTNIGNHYNASTYRFTAPLSGTYMFVGAVYFNTGAANPRVGIRINGAGANGFMSQAYYDRNDNYQPITWLRYLSAGDYVEFYLQNGPWTVYGGGAWQHTFFSGYLVG